MVSKRIGKLVQKNFEILIYYLIFHLDRANIDKNRGERKC